MNARPRHRRGASSVLVLLAVVFLAAGMSRLGLGVAHVIAAEQSTEMVLAGAESGPSGADPGDLFEALRAREARITEAEAALAARSAQMRAAEQELAAQIEALQTAEARLSATLQMTESAAEDDLLRLTTVFENMKPQQASDLFAQMDTEFAAGFIARLRPDFAGEVMAGLDPVIAYAISAVLAGRHARTPRN